MPAVASASIVAAPRRSVSWQVSDVSCERWRTKTSTVASRSPAASSATSSSRLDGAVNENQTEFLIGPQAEPGSSSSSVASAVVPRTSAGSAPRSCGAVRASFGGGAANASAGRAVSTAQQQMTTAPA